MPAFATDSYPVGTLVTTRYDMQCPPQRASVEKSTFPVLFYAFIVRPAALPRGTPMIYAGPIRAATTPDLRAEREHTFIAPKFGRVIIYHPDVNVELIP